MMRAKKRPGLPGKIDHTGVMPNDDETPCVYLRLKGRKEAGVPQTRFHSGTTAALKAAPLQSIGRFAGVR